MNFNFFAIHFASFSLLQKILTPIESEDKAAGKPLGQSNMPPSVVQSDLLGESNGFASALSISSDAGLTHSQQKLERLDIGKAGIFEFTFVSRTPRKTMKVHYFLPTCWTIRSVNPWDCDSRLYLPPYRSNRSTPILFVMHGVKRDADKVLN